MSVVGGLVTGRVVGRAELVLRAAGLEGNGWTESGFETFRKERRRVLLASCWGEETGLVEQQQQQA